MAAKAAEKNAEKDGEVDEKVERAANELRKQGATSAIVSHTLGISYGQARQLTAAYDKRVSHPPQKLVRGAGDIKQAPSGYTVKDGVKAKPKAAKKPIAK